MYHTYRVSRQKQRCITRIAYLDKNSDVSHEEIKQEIRRGGAIMIKELKEALAAEQKAKEEAMRPYNERIKNLKAAISNLEHFNTVADRMNDAEKPEASKILEE